MRLCTCPDLLFLRVFLNLSVSDQWFELVLGCTKYLPSIRDAISPYLDLNTLIKIAVCDILKYIADTRKYSN